MATNENDIPTLDAQEVGSQQEPQESALDAYKARQGRVSRRQASTEIGERARQINEADDGSPRGIIGHTLEAGRSIVRGAAEGIAEIPQVGFDIYEAVVPGEQKIDDIYDQFSDEIVDDIFGAESKTAYGKFLDDTTQFLTVFALTRKVPLPKGGSLGKWAKGTRDSVEAGLKAGTKVKGAAGKSLLAEGTIGAIADIAAFDPSDEQLAEYLAQSPIEPLKSLGEILSYDNESDQLAVVGRIKRAVEGAILGTTFDSLALGFRYLRASRAAKLAKTDSARQALTAEQAELAKRIEKIQGPNPGPEYPVVVHEVAEGRFEVRPNLSYELPSPTKTIGNREYPLFDFNGREVGQIAEFGTKDGDEIASIFFDDEAGEYLIRRQKFFSDDAPVSEVFKSRDEAFEAVKKAGLTEQRPINVMTTLADILDEGPESTILTARGGAEGLTPDHKPLRVFQSREEAEGWAASLELATNARRNATRSKLTEEEITGVINNAGTIIAAVKAGDKAAAVRAMEGGFLHQIHYSGFPTTQQAINASYSDILARELKAGGVSLQDMIDGAREVYGNLPLEKLDRLATNNLEEVQQIGWKHLSGLIAFGKHGENVSAIYDAVLLRPNDALLRNELRESMESMFQLGADLVDAESAVGRSLRMMQERRKVFAEGAVGESDKVTRLQKGRRVNGRTYVDGLIDSEAESLARLLRQADSPEAVFKLLGNQPELLIRNTKDAGWWEKVKNGIRIAETIFTNNLLSGPQTQIIPAVSAVFVGGTEAAARGIGGVISRNPALRREAIDLFASARYDWRESARAWRAAMWSGESVLSPKTSYESLIKGTYGDLVNLPSRSLIASDEAVRMKAYRAYRRTKALREWRENPTLKDLYPDVDEFVRREIDAGFGPDGRAIDGKAMEFAEKHTFASPLAETDALKGLQKLAREAPGMRFIFTFVNAPINIFKYSFGELTGVSAIPKWAKMTDEEKAIQKGRTLLSGGMLASAGFLFYEGRMTGRAPKDPQLREEWLRTRQPYSVNVGGKWLSYQRAEPWSLILGTAADVFTAAGEIGDQTDSGEIGWDTAAVSLMTSFGSALMNKSFLTNATEFFGALADDDAHKAERWLGMQTANLLVPYSSLARSLNADPNYRRARSFGEQVMAQVPGFSETLPPRYDGLGRKALRQSVASRTWNLAKPKSDKTDAIFEQLSERGIGLKAPSPMLGQIDLQKREFAFGREQVPYEFLMEEYSQEIIPLLNELLASDEWKNNRGKNLTGMYASEWQRGEVLRVKRIALNRAKVRMLDEYPELGELSSDLRQLRGKLRGGRDVEGVNTAEEYLQRRKRQTAPPTPEAFEALQP